MADRRRAERRGRLAEWRAALALQVKGYRILGRRIRTPVGEIDLIARRGPTIAFIEVKARRDAVSAMEAVTAASRVRIQNAADYWMARRPDLHELGWRYDIVTVSPQQWPLHIRDAWRPDFAASRL